jgi:hypothetical protein
MGYTAGMNHRRLSRPSARRGALYSILFLMAVLAMALPAQATDAAAVPPAGPWLSLESGHYRFIFRGRDRDYVRDLVACGDEVFRTVTGFFGYAPPGLVPVIIRGDQESPPFGGGTSPFPLRIEMVAGSRYSAKTLLLHELTHYVNGLLPNGFFWVLGSVFGPDLNFAQDGLQLHMMEGFTSLLDGERSSPANEAWLRAAVLEERAWAEPDIWTGGAFQPGALRVYLSQMVFCDYIYRHFGPTALAEIQADYARYPFAGDGPAIQRGTGMDPALLWSRALAELAQRWAGDRYLPSGAILTPQSSLRQEQWRLSTQTERGFLMVRSALDRRPEIGFWIPPAVDPPAAGPRLDDPGQSGFWFPFPGLSGADFGVAASADGRLVVAALPEPVFSADINRPNGSDLWLYRPEPAADGRSWRGEPVRLTRDAHLVQPGISPDGTRVFACQRVSDRYRLVEVDPRNGALSLVFDPVDGKTTRRVLGIAISPDGRRIALNMDSDAQSDIIVADLPPPGGSLTLEDFNWITRDRAMEYQPRFLADGRLAFASDREDALVLYAADPARLELPPVRLLREPVAVTGGDFEAAEYRLPDGSRVAGRAAGEPASLLYTGLTAEGRVVKRIASGKLDGRPVEGFASLEPAYLARQAAMEATLQGQSPVPAPAAGAPDALDGDAVEAAARPYADPALPRYWMPWLEWGGAGLSLGLATQAFSILGQNGWRLQAGWVPDSNQIVGRADFSVTLPWLSLGAWAAQEYGPQSASSFASWSLQRRLGLQGILDLIDLWDPADRRFSLDLQVVCQAGWQLTGPERFDAAQAMAMPAAGDLSLQLGLDAAFWLSAPRSALFGQGGLYLSADWLLQPWNTRMAADAPPFQGARASLEGRLPVGDAVIGLRVRGAWTSDGTSSTWLGQLGAGWGVPEAHWRLDARLEFSLPDGLRAGDRFLYLTALEESGWRLYAQTGAGLSAAGAPAWDGAVQLAAEWNGRPLIYYNNFPVSVGLAANLHLADGLPAFNPAGDLSVWVGFNGQSLQW